MRDTNLFTTVGVLLAAALVVSSVAVVGGLVPDSTSAQSAQSSGTETIQVSASGQTQAEPDLAVIRLEVESTASDPTTARTMVANNVSSVRSALASRGLSEDQIRTVDFNLFRDERRIRRPRTEGDEEIVYRASHSLVIEVEDIDQAGPVIDSAIDAGATNIHDVQFTLSESTRRTLRRQALDDAMANARGQASTLAKSAQLRITGVQSVSTTDVDFRPHRFELAAGGGAGGGTDIESGPVTVSASVSVTYNASG